MSTVHKPARRLACRRCNRQKLQCRWEEEGDSACIRCRRANAVCTSSTPRRLGRPPQGRSPQAEAQNEDNGIGFRRLSGQQDIVDLASPNGDISTNLTSPNGWANFPHWPPPDTSSNGNNGGAPGPSCLPPPDGPSALLSMPQLCEDEDLWHFPIAPCSSTPSNIPTTASSLATGLDGAAGHSEAAGGNPVQPRQVDQQSMAYDQERDGYPPLDSQELYMQKLWGLQRLLYQQLKQVRLMTEAGDTPTPSSAGTSPVLPSRNTPYPVDRILRSAQAFVDMVNYFRSNDSVATPNSAGGSTATTGVASEGTSSSAGAAAAWGAGASGSSGSTSAAGTESQQPSPSSVGVTRSALLELDTPMVFALLSCYVRLIDIYDEMFRHFGRLLPSLLCPRQPILQAGFPQFQLGEFQLRDCGSLQVSITVKVLLHALRCIEKTIGVFGQYSVAGGHMAEQSEPRNIEGQEGDGTADGVLGQFGRDKVAQVMTILERESPGGNSGVRQGSIGSLRGNIKKVNELLEYA